MIVPKLTQNEAKVNKVIKSEESREKEWEGGLFLP